jgi:hypothetical protein
VALTLGILSATTTLAADEGASEREPAETEIEQELEPKFTQDWIQDKFGAVLEIEAGWHQRQPGGRRL